MTLKPTQIPFHPSFWMSRSIPEKASITGGWPYLPKTSGMGLPLIPSRWNPARAGPVFTGCWTGRTDGAHSRQKAWKWSPSLSGIWQGMTPCCMRQPKPSSWAGTIDMPAFHRYGFCDTEAMDEVFLSGLPWKIMKYNSE